MAYHGTKSFAAVLCLLVAFHTLPGVRGQNCPAGLVPSPMPLFATCNNADPGQLDTCTEIDGDPLMALIGAAEVFFTDGIACMLTIHTFTTVSASFDGTVCIARLTTCSAPTTTTTTTPATTTPATTPPGSDDSSDSR